MTSRRQLPSPSSPSTSNLRSLSPASSLSWNRRHLLLNSSRVAFPHPGLFLPQLHRLISSRNHLDPHNPYTLFESCSSSNAVRRVSVQACGRSQDVVYDITSFSHDSDSPPTAPATSFRAFISISSPWKDRSLPSRRSTALYRSTRILLYTLRAR